MSAGFTPGPWQAFPMEKHALKGFVVDTAFGNHAENDYVIADCIFGNHAEANANLIAAAPELYEALAAAVANSDANLAAGQPRLGDFKKLYDKAAAALAKARGEQVPE